MSAVDRIKTQLEQLEQGRTDFIKALEIQLNTQIANYDGQIAALKFAIAQFDPPETTSKKERNHDNT